MQIDEIYFLEKLVLVSKTKRKSSLRIELINFQLEGEK